MFEHGGNIIAAAKHYGIAEEDWLDLSTGINPLGWPVPALPASCWQHLPQDDDGLIEAAMNYYGSKHVLPVAGSQAAIQALPRLRDKGRVGILNPAYFEHGQAWSTAGHDVIHLHADDINQAVDELDVLVVVNPNNPTGERFEIQQLREWHQRLQHKDGWLIVDEAFMDVTPQQSLAVYTEQKGLIVLRSLGKFFGLAGIRVGFVLATSDMLATLRAWLGPWAVSAPARLIAKLALQDTAWQAKTREALITAETRLNTLLSEHGLNSAGGTALFQWITHPHALDIHEALAALGILTRYFPPEHTGVPSLRFGLAGTEADWSRLAAVLGVVVVEDADTVIDGS